MIKKINYLLILLIQFILILFIYYNFDKTEFHNLDIFTWDASIYREMAESINIFSSDKIFTPPFSFRLIFPILYGFFHDLSGFSYVKSAAIISIFFAFATNILI